MDRNTVIRLAGRVDRACLIPYARTPSSTAMPEKLTDDQVRHVAKLSRLRLGEDEVSQMASRLSAVLDYVSKLNELNVDGVEPMAHAMELNNVLREDEPRAGLPNDAVLANAPEKTPPFFRVPKVIGDGGGA